jgi:hypothetical protein
MRSTGKHLGQTLFLLFIIDLPNVIPKSTSTGLYGDDTKLYREISTPEDCSQLQEALPCVDIWSEENNINFNPSKCKILTSSRRKTSFLFEYYLGSSELKRVNDEVDLGITCSEHAVTFHGQPMHINKIKSRRTGCWVCLEEHARPCLQTAVSGALCIFRL